MTTVVVAALGVCVLVNAALLIAQLRFLRAADGSYAAVQREMWVGNLTGMRLLAFLVTGIVFLRWLWQMRVNAEALAPRGHRMKRGWTTGAWLVPVACFFLPKRIINDIWAASSPPDRPRRTEALLTSWWLLFVAAQLLAFPSTSRGPLSTEMAGPRCMSSQECWVSVWCGDLPRCRECVSTVEPGRTPGPAEVSEGVLRGARRVDGRHGDAEAAGRTSLPRDRSWRCARIVTGTTPRPDGWSDPRVSRRIPGPL
ncbi:DUF4328 domain-containing protein [Streptomyces sp. NPDC058217]|uniref:DUF4328 domain-containing protein n=1 Tax=Streptomyces sp. NPDC058217 TaxID=3346384 RepID=UPI0036E54075